MNVFYFPFGDVPPLKSYSAIKANNAKTASALSGVMIVKGKMTMKGGEFGVYPALTEESGASDVFYVMEIMEDYLKCVGTKDYI